jgi:tripartite motif-containing protein 71
MSESHQKALAIDSVGDLLIVDRDEHCIVVMRNRRHIRTFGKVHLSVPCGVAVNSARQIFVVDRGRHRIAVFDRYGSFIHSFGRQGHGQGELSHPRGIAVNPRTNHVIVADTGNRRVLVFTASGDFVRECSGNAGFLFPTGVAVLPNDAIVVVDAYAASLVFFKASGRHLTTWETRVWEGAHSTKLRLPRGVAVDGRGNILVADTSNNRVMLFSLQSTECRCVGNLHTNVTILEGREHFHKDLSLPTSVVVDAAGKIFVADDGNDRVAVYLPDGRFEYELARTPEIKPESRLAFVLGNPRMKTMDSYLCRAILCESGSAFEDPSPLNTPVSEHYFYELEDEYRTDRPHTHAFTIPGIVLAPAVIHVYI